MTWKTTYLKWDDDYDADSLSEYKIREKHFNVDLCHIVVPDDPPPSPRYTGPLCTEDNPCRRCRENEK